MAQYLPLSGGVLTGNLGFGVSPRAALDLGNTGSAVLNEVHFVAGNVGYGADNSDPYTLRKVHDGVNGSHLELNLNDDADESFRVYGNGALYHSFDVGGNAYHKNGLSIGTASLPSGYMLAVAGSAIVGKLVVKQHENWPDYVFGRSYRLPPLRETENYIKRNGHLAGMPPAAEAATAGIDVALNQARLLQKVEELTLHAIAQERTIRRQQLAHGRLRASNARKAAILERLSSIPKPAGAMVGRRKTRKHAKA